MQSIMYDDVYVLSLPSFTWTKVYTGNSSRFGHTCHYATARHMMRIGGSRDADTYAIETTGKLPDLDTLKCDPQGGVALFDMSDCTWGSLYDTNALAYEIPTKVVEKIGGT